MKRTSLIALGMLLAALAFAPALQAQSTLKSLTTQMEDGKLAVVIAIDGSFTREVSFLTSPKRLVVDLTPVSTIAAAPYAQVGQAGVLDFRTGQFKPDTARIVFDLGDNTPAYTVAEVPGGLKIAFWQEAADQPTQPVREPVRETVRETVRQDEEVAATPAEGRNNVFFRVGAGYAFFLKPDYLYENSFSLYGETATDGETYTWKSGPAFEASLGKHFRLGGLQAKAGFEFSYWMFMPQVSVALSLPHPFLSGSNRGVEFIESELLESSFQRYTVYALFALLEKGPLTVWLGPIGGITKGVLKTLDDYVINEKSPYGSTDVTITDSVAYEHTVSQLHLGGLLGLEYRLGDKLSLNLDTKFLLFSPSTIKLPDTLNMMHLQPTLSLQYSF